MMKRLVVHIGWSKTGTTSVQRALFDNRALLLQNGFLYPTSQHAKCDNHRWFCTMTRKPRRWPREFATQSKEVSRRRIDKAKVAFSDIKVMSQRPDVDTIFLSSEYFCSESYSELSALKGVLLEIGIRPEIIMYVRDPADLFISLQQQEIKYRSYIDSPFEANFPFRKTFELFSNVFDGQVVVRLVEPSQVRRSGVIDDVLEYCAVPAEVRSRIGALWLNKSLSAEGMVALQRLRALAFQDQENKPTPEGWLARGAIEQAEKSVRANKPRLKGSIRAAIHRCNKDELRWLKGNMNLSFQSVDYSKLDLADPIEITPIRFGDIFHFDDPTVDLILAKSIKILSRQLSKITYSKAELDRYDPF